MIVYTLLIRWDVYLLTQVSVQHVVYAWFQLLYYSECSLQHIWNVLPQISIFISSLRLSWNHTFLLLREHLTFCKFYANDFVGDYFQQEDLLWVTVWCIVFSFLKFKLDISQGLITCLEEKLLLLVTTHVCQ